MIAPLGGDSEFALEVMVYLYIPTYVDHSSLSIHFV